MTRAWRWWVSPYINHFLQPDTIIPDLSNPQSWNRYGYAINNPVRYNDPDGHCPICISAFVGAAIGFGVSYGSEVYKNIQEGKTLSDAMNFKNIDRTKVVAATVGGAVSGALMGVAAPALAGALSSEIAAYGIAGGIANAGGGIAESLTVASAKQVENSVSQGSWTWDRNQFVTDAEEAGLNPGNIAFNFGTGGLLSMGTYPMVRGSTGPIKRIPTSLFFDDVYFQSKGYLVGLDAAAIKTTTGLVQQKIQTSLSDALNKRKQQRLEK